MEVGTLIIGAGISGLAYAKFSGEDYYIVEKEDEVGGLCRTFYVDDFVWDYAGHFFHFSNPKIKSFFDTKVKSEGLVTCEKDTKIYYKGALIEYPFQMNIHQLDKEEFIDCLYDLFHKKEADEYSSFESMLYGKFGKSITEKFLKPYNEKLYACNLNDLDPDAMGRFFPYANSIQIIENMKKKKTDTYNNYFEYPKRGAKVFIDALLGDLNADKIQLNANVQSINPKKKIANVNGEQIKYDKLITTIPFNELLKILPVNQSLRTLECLHSNKVLVFNIGFDKGPLNKSIHWMYFPDKNINFYRVGFYNNILGNSKLSIYVEIGFAPDAKIDIENQYEETLKNLKECKIITDHKVIAHNAVIIDPAYVRITTESKEAVNSFIKKMNSLNIYSIGRYGKWTYCSIEDCILQVLEIINQSN